MIRNIQYLIIMSMNLENGTFGRASELPSIFNLLSHDRLPEERCQGVDLLGRVFVDTTTTVSENMQKISE